MIVLILVIISILHLTVGILIYKVHMLNKKLDKNTKIRRDRYRNLFTSDGSKLKERLVQTEPVDALAEELEEESNIVEEQDLSLIPRSIRTTLITIEDELPCQDDPKNE